MSSLRPVLKLQEKMSFTSASGNTAKIVCSTPVKTHFFFFLTNTRSYINIKIRNLSNISLLINLLSCQAMSSRHLIGCDKVSYSQPLLTKIVLGFHLWLFVQTFILDMFLCASTSRICVIKKNLCIWHSFRPKVEACARRHKINYNFFSKRDPSKKVC